MTAKKTKISATASQSKTGSSERTPHVVITGGAGFIGSNLAARLLASGERVVLFDNMSGAASQPNWEWLSLDFGDRVELQSEDIRDAGTLERAVADASKVFHCASQVDVLRSLENPVEDFEINVRGTLNLLESLRRVPKAPALIYISSEKIYGDHSDLRFNPGEKRYEPEDPAFRINGFGEGRPLRFQTPFGCSKGAATQYVLDYAKTFKIPAAAVCLSAVYGPRQLGAGDQEWVAQLVMSAMRQKPLTICGDCRLTRDILFIDDLVEAVLALTDQIERLSGQTFNIGGGPQNAVSIMEIADIVAGLRNKRPELTFEPWRSGNARYFVSDIRKFSRATGWSPSVGPKEGIERFCRWMELECPQPVASRITNQQLDAVPAA